MSVRNLEMDSVEFSGIGHPEVDERPLFSVSNLCKKSLRKTAKSFIFKLFQYNRDFSEKKLERQFSALPSREEYCCLERFELR